MTVVLVSPRRVSIAPSLTFLKNSETDFSKLRRNFPIFEESVKVLEVIKEVLKKYQSVKKIHILTHNRELTNPQLEGLRREVLKLGYDLVRSDAQYCKLGRSFPITAK